MSESPQRPAAGPPGWLDTVASEARALLDSLFDLSFRRFVTPRIVRVLYSLSLLAALLSALAWMFSGFGAGFLHGLFTLVTGPLAFLFYALCARVAVELVLAIFRIAEQLDSRASSQESVRPVGRD